MKTRHVLLSAGTALVIGSAANAAMLGPVFTIMADAGRAGTASFTIDQSMLQQTSRDDGSMAWTLAHPVELLGNYGTTLGTLTNASLSIVTGDSSSRAVSDGSVALNFTVLNGPASASYMVTSAVENFAPSLVNASGTSSAGLSITDGDGDGVMLTGEFGGGEAYQARYNGGTVYASLLGNLSTATQFGTTIDNDGTGPIATLGGVDVSDIQSEWKFSITANDQASGTSIFYVVAVPSPGAGALAGLAGLAAIRRRRH